MPGFFANASLCKEDTDGSRHYTCPKTSATTQQDQDLVTKLGQHMQWAEEDSMIEGKQMMSSDLSAEGSWLRIGLRAGMMPWHWTTVSCALLHCFRAAAST